MSAPSSFAELSRSCWRSPRSSAVPRRGSIRPVAAQFQWLQYRYRRVASRFPATWRRNQRTRGDLQIEGCRGAFIPPASTLERPVCGLEQRDAGATSGERKRGGTAHDPRAEDRDVAGLRQCEAPKLAGFNATAPGIAEVLLHQRFNEYKTRG
jgi:hypothetical protein